MAPRATRRPNDAPATFTVVPLQPTPKQQTAGRPPNPKEPPFPLFEMVDYEKKLYDYYLWALEKDYPNMRPSDKVLLPLVGVGLILYLRTAQKQLTENEIISMTRQHPGAE